MARDAQEVTPLLGTAGLAAQGQRHKSSSQVLPKQPRKIKQIKKSLWGTTISTGRFPTASSWHFFTHDNPWDHVRCSCRCFDFFPGAISPQLPVAHHPNNVSWQGTDPEIPGNKESAVPTTMVHSPYWLPWERKRDTWSMQEHGMERGTVATAMTSFMYSNFPSCWNDARRRKSMEKPKTTEIPIKAWAKILHIKTTSWPEFCIFLI